MRVAAIALLALASPGLAEVPSTSAGCWEVPTAQTVQEAVIVAQNESERVARASRRGTPAMLALSDGRLKAAYGAGLIVGWGETVNRPEFAVVTAVGTSALIAPFAFLGRAGDRAIADIFACGAPSMQGMAQNAASHLTESVIQQIAARHRAGGRLFIAIPGSAARPETVWDFGIIAASRHRDAASLMARLLAAAVDLTTYVDPDTSPVKAGTKVVRNPELRRAGAGEPFLSAPSLKAPPVPMFLIHNGVVFADEGEEFAAARMSKPSAGPADAWLVPAYDLFSARDESAPTLIASPRAHMNIQTQQSDFDMTYMRALFLHSYRQGRMRREWRSTLIDYAAQ
jgi:hypothetical protein